MKVLRNMEMFLAGFMTVIAFLFGEPDGLLICLVLFMVVDFVTGVVVAFQDKTLDSRVSFKGLRKKVVILFLIAVSHWLDVYVLHAEILRNVVVSFYIANEGLSILENTGKLGVKYPKKLEDALMQLTEEKEKENKNEDRN